ncbi:hypothetical protein GGH97_006639, partial [Coemansia sp. RSA 475]
HFVDIAHKARTQGAQKQETKTVLDEYELKLKEARAKATGEDDGDELLGVDKDDAQIQSQVSQYSDDEEMA